ncbi:MAG: hypothetical protein WAQ08_05860 [Aquabacterium sp.]|uniref:hypothetical protein n=1 Tax=Aquabacterium sp. TaxID=1872578 RepID=UPI003BAFE3D6
MIDILAAKRSCLPMGNRLYIGGSSKSSSSNATNTITTDNRAVGGDNAIIIGQGGVFQGVDPGIAQITRMNNELMREQMITQTDGVKFLIGAGEKVLSGLGENVTDIYKTSGANALTAWSNTIDASESIMDKLTAGAKANADASQVVAVAALNANKSDASGLSDAFKYTAIAAAVIGAVWVMSKGK